MRSAALPWKPAKISKSLTNRSRERYTALPGPPLTMAGQLFFRQPIIGAPSGPDCPTELRGGG